jgi:hypothetical protein
VLADGSIPGGFGETRARDVRQLTLDDSELRGALQHRGQPSGQGSRRRPHRTVSQSEAGFEKIMQAVCITLAWSPAAGKEQRITLRVIPAS